MKKVLTILLTLVMAICLINLNNSHTKAEDNPAQKTVTINPMTNGTVSADKAGYDAEETVTLTVTPNPGYALDKITVKNNAQEEVQLTKGTGNTYTFMIFSDVTVDATFKAIQPLTFTAQQAGSTVKFKLASGSDVQYKTTGTTSPNAADWTDYTAGTTITLTNVGDSVSFKGTSVTTDPNNCFSMTGKIAASGDVTSLTNGIGGDVSLTQNCYLFMFRNCTALTTVPNLPSTTLALGCYSNMFDGCTGLTSVPSDLLPSMVLTNYCYNGMFNNCTSLTNVPNLPATTLADYCYKEMFYNCTSLITLPSGLLPATTLNQQCYLKMFYGCTGLTTIPTELLPATMLAYSCYNSMFKGCSNLVNIPDLPASTLANYCYAGMFEDCSKLKLSESNTGDYIIPFSIPKSGTTQYKTDCTKYMFLGTGGEYTGTPLPEGSTSKKLYVAGDTTSPEVSGECAKGASTNLSIVEEAGSQAEVKLTGFSGTATTIKLNNSSDLVKGADYTIVPVSTTDINASDYAIRLSKLFISTLPVGSHEVKVTKGSDTWTINIKIEAKPSPSPTPSPSPSKKDESCEKVIGPTWHWNNDKGICEDIGVVGTATR